MPSLHDLLPIPRGTTVPNAYDAFGLQPGEQDLDAIRVRIAAVVQKLKSVKDQSDPQLWQHAAKFVDQSRKLLADPKRKAALDAQLQWATDQSMVRSDPAKATDPLAGLLPSGDPMQPVPSSAPDVPRSAVSMPPGLFGTPDQPSHSDSDAKDAPEDVAMDAPNHAPTGTSTNVVTRTGSVADRRRRKRAPLTGWLLGSLIIALIGATGLLSYFLLAGSGTIRIVKSDNEITISADQPVSGDRRDPAPDRETDALNHGLPEGPISASKEPFGNRIPDSQSQTDDLRFGQPSGITQGLDVTFSEDKSIPPPEAIDASPSMTEATQPEVTSNANATSKPSEPLQPNPTTPERPMFEDSKQRAAMDGTQQLIREANWSQMKPAAEALTEMRLSEDNQVVARGLFELADLATFYRVGIEQAVKELKAGNEMVITDTFRVVVVETGEDLLTIRYSKKNRSFTFDEFPMSLAHRLASYQVTDDDTGRAAKAAYQAIAPVATPAHRDQAIAWLEEIRGEIPGADRDRLVRTIELIYQSDQE